MELYIDQLKDIAFDIYRDKNGNHYCNDIFCFDIEVSSAWINEHGDIITYEKGKSAEYWNSLRALSLPYIWQFSWNNHTYYGREFFMFKKLLHDISDNNDMIWTCWVHNLSYEFQFLCNIFNWKTVFARSAHKVMKSTPEEFPNMEFRCSYFLTRLSLENWALQTGIVTKKVGNLDYNVLRTPLTPLNDVELQYCEYDLLCMYYGLLTYKQRYKTIQNIPLTQTGTVRRHVKELLTTDENYVRDLKRLVPPNAKVYKMLMELFAGGYTHANRLHSGIVQCGIIEHYDFASSYPYVMLVEKFPMTPWVMDFTNTFPDENTFEDTAYIMRLKFSQLNSTSYNTYIQAYKCTYTNPVLDNGRVISADTCELYVTEQDYITIANNYEWNNMEVRQVWSSKKDYLPKKFLDYILELYENKTKLKGIEEMNDIYLQSKQYINSLFGMMVTAIIQESIDYNDSTGEWTAETLTEENVNERLKKLRNGNKREKRYFLSYSWGIWVTAYARRNLWKCIESIDENMIYADTDSIFADGVQDFAWYNEEVNKKVKQTCKDNGLNIERTRPKDKKGIEHPIGIFSKEDDCTEFITLGAKRYCERRKSDGKLHLTVSGINKQAVGILDDDIYNFKDGIDFDKDSEYVNKRLLTYLSDMPDIKYPDGYYSTYKYGINMRNNGYKLTMTDEYKRLIMYDNISINDFSERTSNQLKGVWK